MTEADRDLLLREIGEPPDGQIAAALAGLAARYGALADPAHTLAIRRDAMRLRLMDLWRRIRGTTDAEEERALRLELDTLRLLFDSDTAALTSATTGTTRAGGVVVGQRTTLAPTTAPTGAQDANDPRYRGTPYAPRYPI